jgi:hypothetical protein
MISLLAGRGLSIVGVITAALLALWGWGYSQQWKGVEKERAASIKRGAKLNAQAKRAADSARTNPKRVLERYYRD